MEIVTNKINRDLILDEYKSGIHFGTDALLLAHYTDKHRRCVDLGSGSGVLSFLLLSSKKIKYAAGIELQEEYACLSLKNAEKNGFSDNFDCFNADVNDISKHLEKDSFECVVTNPPYLKENQGKNNDSRLKYLAFHETSADINGFLKAASFLLKTRGAFYAVYRPEYLAKLLNAMTQNKISCKKLRFVYPSPSKPPNLILVKGIKNGAEGLKIEPPLYIYNDGTHKSFSEEMKEIYNVF